MWTTRFCLLICPDGARESAFVCPPWDLMDELVGLRKGEVARAKVRMERNNFIVISKYGEIYKVSGFSVYQGYNIKFIL